MVNKTKKTRKSVRKRGTTNYHGARKKWKSSGHKGGKGMAGSGKRADHKKSLVIKLYGNSYFGKQGITSRGTEKDRTKVLNVRDIEINLDSLMKKHGKSDILDLSEYKILGEGELTKKVKIKAMAFSKSARAKIEKAHGEAINAKKEEVKELKTKPEKKEAVVSKEKEKTYS